MPLFLVAFLLLVVWPGAPFVALLPLVALLLVETKCGPTEV